MWIIFKVFIDFVTILHLFSVSVVLLLLFERHFGILVPRPGIKLATPASEGKVLNTGLPGKPQKASYKS